MKSIIFAILLLLMWMATYPAIAGLNETLPTYHWAYNYIDQLRLGGYFDDLFILNKPYTRGEIARYLVEIEKEIVNSQIKPDQNDSYLINLLVREFSDEMKSLSSFKKSDEIKFGTYLIPDFQNSKEEHSMLYGPYRACSSFSVGNYITLYSSINFDKSLISDPNYWGKKKWGYAGYAEQGYVRVNLGKLAIHIGRDFMKWGSGRSGNLLVSDYSRPMDFVSANIKLKYFKLSYFLANLDRMKLPDSLSSRYKSYYSNRYLSVHRIDFKLLRGRFNLGLSEALLYGGPQRNVEFAYANPFISYFGVVENDRIGYENGGKGNIFASFDFDIFPQNNYELYGELLVDDFQVEKTGPGDLEPPEWGFLVGSQVADPFGWQGTTVLTEYVRITNRTYNALNPWEKFLNYNRPIGYYLGNDFDRLEFKINHWIKNDVRMSLKFTKIRKGEGKIKKNFDTPWMNYTVQQGYHEAFPTGIVEKTNSLGVQFLYQNSSYLQAFLAVNYSSIRNLDNLPQNYKKDFSIRAGFTLEWNWSAILASE